MAERDPHDPLGRKQSNRTWRTWAAGIATVLALILIFQNSQKVEFKFFFVEGETPLFFGLIIAVLLGALIGWLLHRIRGSRRRDEERERD